LEEEFEQGLGLMSGDVAEHGRPNLGAIREQGLAKHPKIAILQLSRQGLQPGADIS
jgi:hypothetical protein